MANSILRCAYYQELATVRCYNVFHLEILETDPGAADDQEAFDRFVRPMWIRFAPAFWMQNLSGWGVECKWMVGPLAGQEFARPITGIALGAGMRAPPVLSVMVRLEGGDSGTPRRGRKFFPGCPSTCCLPMPNNGPQMSGTVITPAALEAMFVDPIVPVPGLPAAGWHVLYRHDGHHVNRVTDAFLRPVYGVVRRRRPPAS